MGPTLPEDCISQELLRSRKALAIWVLWLTMKCVIRVLTQLQARARLDGSVGVSHASETTPTQ